MEKREDFEKRHNQGVGDKFDGRWVSMICHCDHSGPESHWAAVRNTPEDIALHLDLEKMNNRGLDVHKGT